MLTLKKIFHRPAPREEGESSAVAPRPPAPPAGMTAEEWRTLPPVLAGIRLLPPVASAVSEKKYLATLRDSGFFRGMPFIWSGNAPERGAALQAVMRGIDPAQIAACIAAAADTDAYDALPTATGRGAAPVRRWYAARLLSAAFGWSFSKVGLAELWTENYTLRKDIQAARRGAGKHLKTRDRALKKSRQVADSAKLPLDLPQVLALLEAVECEKPLITLKMRLMMALSFDFLLRSEEVSQICAQDILPAPGGKFSLRIPVRKNTGGDSAILSALLSDISRPLLAEYLAASKIKAGWLFPGEMAKSAGAPIPLRSLRRRFADAARACPAVNQTGEEWKQFGWHSFRKARARDLLGRGGLSLPAVQQLGGWKPGSNELEEVYAVWMAEQQAIPDITRDG